MAEVNLVPRARQGDQEAWILLVREHQEAIFHLAYLILGDPDDAEDIAQETFIRAYRSLDRFDERRPLRPWLLRIAKNLSHNQRRSVGRYWAALIRFGRSEVDEKRDVTEEARTQREKSRRLWEAVKKLQRADQDVIYLRYFLELSVEETAAVLEVAQGTVKSRLHRSLERLEAVITRDFPELKEDVA